MNVPNLLTGLRLLAVPVFVWFFLQGHHRAALAVFVGALITDWLDGVLARALKQFTQLGALLDP
ncbi:MAG: CDP-alcohol phosphatidyltransferase family protein, partial [Myxococcales bacterium]